jgi:hypothetical protein
LDGADNRHRRTSGSQPLERSRQLEVLEFLFDQDRDALALQRHRWGLYPKSKIAAWYHEATKGTKATKLYELPDFVFFVLFVAS